MTKSVAILADDLTGALDAAAPFARPSESVRVSWRCDTLQGAARSAYDTESRAVGPRTATARIRSSLELLRAADLSFKKADSLVRGNTLAEIAACASSGAFRSVVVAPAFPEQGRITRCGTQIVHSEGGGAAATIDLAGGLVRRRVPVRLVGRGDTLPEQGVMLCDAETGADLLRLVDDGARLVPPVLWCGSAGLARALGRHRPAAHRLAGPRLVVVGSRHSVARAQTERLRHEIGDAAVVVASGADVIRSVGAITDMLDTGRSCALIFVFSALDPIAARMTMVGAFNRLAHAPPPGTLVVVGGDTLFRLCAALGASSLLATGEWAPGIPVARIVGGCWDDVQLVAKSGAFADRNVLVRLLDSKAGESCF
ncbi:MAG: Hrp-dependent type III effector protein [Bauldia sp.]|nr:Hrp-dependent type III effector protein [Bauldia sp.]